MVLDENNRLGFRVGQTLILKVKVEDVEKAQKLLAWMHKDKAYEKVEDFGCSLESLGWVDQTALIQEALAPLKKLIAEGVI